VDETFGTWRLSCTRDAMTDKAKCTLESESHGRGVFGETTLHFFIYSANKNAAPAIVLNIPVMTLLHGVVYRLDGQDAKKLLCTEVSGDNCLIQGAPRTACIDGMAAASHMVVRVFDFSGDPFDFDFDVRNFRKAMIEFNAVAATYL
jgi:invasion protein IalB